MLAVKYLPDLKALEATSAIEFPFPAMCIGSRDETCLTRCRICKSRKRHAALIDFEVWPL